MKTVVNLLDLTIEELQDMFMKMGQEKFRARQVFEWLGKGVKDMDGMTNLSRELRQTLKGISYIGHLAIRRKIVSKDDGTAKYLFELPDGNIIESVLMEYRTGFTFCLSSQVGCKMGCRFCASTGIGFVRNLTPGEILGQVLAIQADIGKRAENIVLMGIGEPFDNYGNVLKFLKNVNAAEGLNIGYRRITISTCGMVPEILKFMEEKIPVNLSVSLHAPNDAIRSRLMPAGSKYSIDKIIEACKIYTEATKRRVTFEYVAISKVNDSIENAYELGGRLKGMLCHVNLIPLNTVSGSDFKRSGRTEMERFKSILEGFGIETTIRRELGNDINAACGQLRRSAITFLE